VYYTDENIPTYFRQDDDSSFEGTLVSRGYEEVYEDPDFVYGYITFMLEGRSQVFGLAVPSVRRKDHGYRGFEMFDVEPPLGVYEERNMQGIKDGDLMIVYFNGEVVDIGDHEYHIGGIGSVTEQCVDSRSNRGLLRSLFSAGISKIKHN